MAIFRNYLADNYTEEWDKIIEFKPELELGMTEEVNELYAKIVKVSKKKKKKEGKVFNLKVIF
jgi:hypothetical protein